MTILCGPSGLGAFLISAEVQTLTWVCFPDPTTTPTRHPFRGVAGRGGRTSLSRLGQTVSGSLEEPQAGHSVVTVACFVTCGLFGSKVGAPGAIRTPGLRFRKWRLRYPVFVEAEELSASAATLRGFQ